jgi:putative PEP-CTERM system TPR-repeat lipoprotein
MTDGLFLVLRRIAKLAALGRAAMPMALILAVTALAACDPRGSASVEQLVKRAEEQRAAGNVRASIIELKNALQKDGKSAQARLLLGQSFVDLGDAASAEIELKRAKELGADAGRTTLLLGEVRLLQGRIPQLLTEFPVPEDGAAETKAAFLELRGRAHLMAGQRVQSEQAFKAALELNPKLAEAELGLARIAFATGNPAAGRDHLARAVAIAPENPKVLMVQGDAAFAAKDYEGAENHFKQVLKLRKDDLLALNASLGIGRAQIAAGKLKDASARLTQTLKQAPNHPEANYLRALAAYQSKEYDLAKTHAETALRTAPNHRQSIFIAGAASYALQQNELALRYLTTFVNAVPENAEGRKLLAALQMRMGQPSQAARTLQAAKTQDAQMLAMAGAAAAQAGDPSAAKESLERAASADPRNVGARAQLGMTRISLGETEEGFKDLEAASKLDPGSDADVALALSYIRAGDYDKAIEAAKRIQQRQSAKAIGFTLEGVSLRAKRDDAAAKAAFRKALEAEPGDRTALENLALMALSQNQPDEARGYYNELATRNPDNGSVQVLVAQFDLQTGRAADAVSRMQSLVSAQPEFLEGYVALARAQIAMGNAQQALTVTNNAAQRWPDHPDVLMTRGQAQMRLGQVGEAIASFRAAVAKAPQHPVGYQLLAIAYQASGDRARALAEVDRGLGVQPASAPLRLMRALLLAETGKIDDAVRIASELRASNPNAPQVAELEGALALAQGHPMDAINSYQQALSGNPTTENVIGLARAQTAARQPEKGEQTLKDWLAKYPDDARARIVLGDSYLNRRMLPDAEKQYGEVLKVAPDAAVVLNNLAWVMSQQGRAKEALPHARKAAELAPENPAVLDTLGTTLVRAGFAAEAIAPLRKALEKAPGVRPLQYHLADALAKQGQREEAKSLLSQALEGSEPFEERSEAEKLWRELGA